MGKESMVRRLSSWKFAIAALFLCSLFAHADFGNMVNQGSPGTYGAWPVSPGTNSGSGGASATSSRNVLVLAATTTALTANGVACTAPGGASCTIIFAATDMSSWTNVTISLSDTDGANAITNVLVEWSPDNSHFEAWDTTTLAGLTAGTTKSIAIGNNSRRFLRLEARAAANVTSAVVNISSNDG